MGSASVLREFGSVKEKDRSRIEEGSPGTRLSRPSSMYE